MRIKNDNPHTVRLHDAQLADGVMADEYPGDPETGRKPGIRFDEVPDEAVTIDDETGEEVIEFRVANVTREVGEALVASDRYPTISEYNGGGD